VLRQRVASANRSLVNILVAKILAVVAGMVNTVKFSFCLLHYTIFSPFSYAVCTCRRSHKFFGCLLIARSLHPPIFSPLETGFLHMCDGSKFALFPFYPHDVVSGVLATATRLSGWVPGCPSHAGIVSKRLNLSENFFEHLKAPYHSSFLRPMCRYKIPRGTLQRAINTREGEVTIFVRFSTDIAVYLGNGAR